MTRHSKLLINDANKARGDNRASQEGYILVSILLLSALAALLTIIALDSSSAGRKAIASTRKAETEFFNAEGAMQTAYAWINEQSANWGSLFSGSVFVATFTRSTTPSVGSNDTGQFTVPTRIKLLGTNNSAIIHNRTAAFGSAAFPASTNLITGASYDALTDFSAKVNLDSLVRITLVDAIPLDPTSPATTEYSPVFRIDALRAADRGGQVSALVTGKMLTTPGSGFSGRDFIELRQSCDSYQSSTASPNYSTTSRRANCPIGSEGPVYIHSSATVNGSVTTKSSIATGSPWGGSICASFASGCPVQGTICAGSTCNPPTMTLTPSSFAAACSSTAPDLTISSGTSEATAWTIESAKAPNTTTNQPSGTPANTYRNNCWNNLKINSNRWVRFRAGLSGSTPTAFYIKTLDIANNATVLFDDNGGKQITLYVEKIVGNSYNGNQIGGLKSTQPTAMIPPNMLKVNYWGTAALTLNGNAMMNSFLVAPNAGVTVSGNFTYNGGIMAKSLVASGAGALHYDETGGNAVNIDMQLRMRTMNEYFR